MYPFEDNWANAIDKLRVKYDLPNDDIIVSMSKDSWKNMVKKAIEDVAYKTLLKKCKSMSKTLCLQHDTFKMQNYLVSYPYDVASIIFKLRGRSTNCLSNRGDDGCCRLCGNILESQNHGINCPNVSSDNEPVSVTAIYGDVPPNDKRVMEIVSRYNRFENALKQITGLNVV